MPVDLLPPDLEIVYPDSDGEPIAESRAHFEALADLYRLLDHWFDNQEAMVFANQFLYYEEGNPQQRVTPDSMIVLGAKLPDPGNYKRGLHSKWTDANCACWTIVLANPC